MYDILMEEEAKLKNSVLTANYLKTAKETWNPISHWEGLFEISNLGRVRSLRCCFSYDAKRQVWYVKNQPHIMKPIHDRGQWKIQLTWKGRLWKRSILKLVEDEHGKKWSSILKYALYMHETFNRTEDDYYVCDNGKGKYSIRTEEKKEQYKDEINKIKLEKRNRRRVPRVGEDTEEASGE